MYWGFISFFPSFYDCGNGSVFEEFHVVNGAIEVILFAYAIELAVCNVELELREYLSKLLL